MCPFQFLAFPVDSIVVGARGVPSGVAREDLPTSERITKRVLDALKLTDERTILFDSDLRGFGVRATRNTKTFFVQYRAGSGRTAPKRRLSLGRYGALTVEEARTIARKVLA